MNRQASIVIVTRPTRLGLLLKRWTTRSACKFHLAQARLHEVARGGAAVVEASPEALADAEFAQYEAEDRAFHETLRRIKRDLDLGYPLAAIDRELLPSFDFRSAAAIVVVGQDGLVANVAKYAGDLPIVGANPDPARLDGVLLPFAPSEVRQATAQSLAGAARIRDVTLAEAELNDGQRLLAFNDLFLGAASHVSARYLMTVDGETERHSSSGLIVSTGAGSTGWLSSVFNMAAGVARWRGEEVPTPLKMKWDDRRLAWVVREPFISKQSSANLVAGMLIDGDELVVESLMPEGGVIFSDGVEADYLSFNSGAIARIRKSEQTARLVQRPKAA